MQQLIGIITIVSILFHSTFSYSQEFIDLPLGNNTSGYGPLAVNIFEKLSHAQQSTCKNILIPENTQYHKLIRSITNKKNKLNFYQHTSMIAGIMTMIGSPMATMIYLDHRGFSFGDFGFFFALLTSFAIFLPLIWKTAFYFHKKMQPYEEQVNELKSKKSEFLSDLQNSLKNQLTPDVEGLRFNRILNRLKNNFSKDNQNQNVLLGYILDNNQDLSNAQKKITEVMQQNSNDTSLEYIDLLLGKYVTLKQKLIIADKNKANMKELSESAIYTTTGKLIKYEIIENRIIRFYIDTSDNNFGYVDIPYGKQDYSNWINNNLEFSQNNNVHMLTKQQNLNAINNEYKEILSYYYLTEVSPEKIERLKKLYQYKSSLRRINQSQVEFLLGAYYQALVNEGKGMDLIGLTFNADYNSIKQLQILSDPTIDVSSSVYLKAEQDYKNPIYFDKFDGEFKIIKFDYTQNDNQLVHIQRLTDNQNYIIPMSAAEWIKAKANFKHDDYRRMLARTIKNSLPNWGQSKLTINNKIEQTTGNKDITTPALEDVSADVLLLVDQPIKVPVYLDR